MHDFCKKVAADDMSSAAMCVMLTNKLQVIERDRRIIDLNPMAVLH